MDRQTYTRLLHARIEHIENALRRSLGQDLESVAGTELDALRSHAATIDAAGDDWAQHREGVESSLEALTTSIDSHRGTAVEVADAIRDGAVELFRGEPSEILATANAILRRAQEKAGG